MQSTFLNHINAEIKKLKSTPIIYLVLFCCLFISVIIIIAHSLDINSTARLNTDPWKRLFAAGLSIYSFFVINPFVVLLVSAVMYVEQRADAWKLLYTLPVGRGSIYFSKLLVIIGITIGCSLVLVLFLVLSGYFINLFYPEIEVVYYQPDILALFKKIFHTIVALLGVIGLQYFLSLWFKNFLVPLSLGVVGFILGFIVTTTNSKIALCIPFTFPMIVKDYGMFRNDKVAYVFGDWLTNVELYSIIFFVVFVALGYFYETRRNVV